MTLPQSSNTQQEQPVATEAISSINQTGRRSSPKPLSERIQHMGREFAAKLSWPHVIVGAVLLLLTTTVIVLYYFNKPSPEIDPDTPAYLNLAHEYATQGLRLNLVRLPGYPLMMWFIFALTGKDNLAAMQLAQAALFAIATIEIYALLCLIQKRISVAFITALLIGANLIILSYIKSILSEGLELFLLVNMALAIIFYLRKPGRASLWAVTLFLLALFLTRPEWIYLPIVLFPLLFWIASWRGAWRMILPHAVVALLLLYVVVGGYITANKVRHNCSCITEVQNINLLGKVMQYHMQNEAPPEYAAMTKVVNSYVSRGSVDPWDVIRSGYAPATRNGDTLMGEYSEAIILRHPVEFLADSLPIGVKSLTTTSPFRPLHTDGPNLAVLNPLEGFSTALLDTLILFPFLTIFWWVLLLRKRKSASLLIQAMAVLSFVAFYGFALTTLGGYVYYPRLHTPFDPLMIAVVWGSLLIGGYWLAGHLVQWVQAQRR